MTTLTKEHLEQALAAQSDRFDEKLEKALARHHASLEKKIETEAENLAAMTARRFADLEKRLDVKDRVETLERKMSKVESALNVNL